MLIVMWLLTRLSIWDRATRCANEDKEGSEKRIPSKNVIWIEVVVSRWKEHRTTH